ncbi:2193_t:CDS:2 [Funneliformis mosseae]|uniref:2193_t:CDS:1 n=1 Tax=Funneliformis mosseae TaxID=27381 RepID=A0A9N9BAI7_FUNMO|nr:2193_t:CDS:2 [Funneliformis mosseae]
MRMDGNSLVCSQKRFVIGRRLSRYSKSPLIMLNIYRTVEKEYCSS